MKKGYLYIALSTTLFSTMEIALKLFSIGYDPMQINFIRFLIGSMLLFPHSLKILKSRNIRLHTGDIRFFALTGFLCVVVSMTLYQFAVIRTDASVVAILVCCNPVFAILFAFVLLREKIRKTDILSVVVSMIGILCVMNPLKIGTASRSGIVLSILTAVTFALYGVVGKLRVEKYGSIVLCFFSFLMGCLELLMLIFISRVSVVSSALDAAGLSKFADIPILKGITLQNLPGIAYLGIFVTGLGYTFYFLAMETTSVSKASLIFFIKIALAPVLALLFLHESITMNILFGIAFIIIGSGITFFPQGKSEKQPLR